MLLVMSYPQQVILIKLYQLTREQLLKTEGAVDKNGVKA